MKLALLLSRNPYTEGVSEGYVENGGVYVCTARGGKMVGCMCVPHVEGKWEIH